MFKHLSRLYYIYGEHKAARKIRYEGYSAEEREIYSGRKNFIVDNISAFIIISIAAGSYLAGLLSYVGVPVAYNGLILSVPVLASVFQFFGAIVSKRLNSQKSYVVLGIAVQRYGLSLVFLYPLIFGAEIITIVLVVITYAIAFFMGALVGPANNNWLVSFVPSKERGNYFSKREKYSLFGIALTTLFVGFVLDKSEQQNAIEWGFAIIGIFFFIVSTINVIHLAKIRENFDVTKKEKFKFADIIEPLRDKTFIKVIFILIMWQASTQIAIPFLGIYYIDSIGMSYSIIGLVSLIITLEKAVIVSRWGKFADRTSWDYVLKIATIIYAFSKVILIFLSPSNYAFIFPLSMIIGNVAWSILGISLINLQFTFSNPKNTVMYIGVCGSISGLAGFGFALLGSNILALFDGKDYFINGNQFLLILSSVIAFIMSFYIHRAMKHERLNLKKFIKWNEKAKK